MRPTSVAVAATATSAPIPVDWRNENFNVSVAVVKSGTNTYSVEHTYDDVFNSSVTPTWFTHATVAGLTVSSTGVYLSPVRAVRLNVTAHTTGTVTLTVLQAG